MKNKLAMSFRWVGVMLICMGIIFLGVGTFVGYYALTSGEIPAEEIVALSVAFLGMFGGFGVIVLAVGVIILVKAAGAARLKERLIEEGNYVWAELQDVSKNYTVRINGHSPFVLRCRYRHSDGKTYVFKSRYLRYDPQDMIAGERVRVWFDRDDISKYYVDVEGSVDNDLIEL